MLNKTNLTVFTSFVDKHTFYPVICLWLTDEEGKTERKRNNGCPIFPFFPFYLYQSK